MDVHNPVDAFVDVEEEDAIDDRMPLSLLLSAFTELSRFPVTFHNVRSADSGHSGLSAQATNNRYFFVIDL